MKYLVIIITLLLISCQSEEEKYAYIVNKYILEQPSNFPNPIYNFENNPLTEKGVLLGKELFYDGNLASDGIVACAFCHIQKNAFTHHGHSLSHGVEDRIGTRNAPPLQNLIYNKYFMWDGVAENLDLVSIIPITSEFEMDHNLTEIMEYLKVSRSYNKMFKEAFIDGEINSENFLKAISQFLATLISSNSKYDKVIRNEGEIFTSTEQRGYEVFLRKCSTCHSSSLFTDQTFRNTGLPINPIVDDKGRFKFTELEVDAYKFRVPSLRNIALTAPYMHDGRFLNLDAVLDFYTNGVVNTQNLDASLIQTNGRLGISLSDQEKQDIKQFLETLTDIEFISNSKFSEF